MPRLALCVVLAALAGGARAGSTLAPEERALAELIAERQAAMERTLASWVEQNTGSLHAAGLERFAHLLAAELRALRFEVSVEPGASIEIPGQSPLPTGPLVVARRGAPGAGAPHLLLNGHYDTVFEPASPFQHYRADPGGTRAYGPGVTDMKGGLLVALEALRALDTDGTLDRARVTVVLNGDEELGSLGSRARIEALAREADLGLVFESARENGAMVRSRRGLGQFHLEVEGVSAHAGGAHEKGRSAVLELAHKVIAIEGLTDRPQGLTLNVGTVQGGSKRNVVPAHASAWIDLRYDRAEQGERVRAALERIAARSQVPGTRARLWGTLHRPPKTATPEMERLLSRHREVASALGLPLPEPEHVGGGTDGSLMAAVGLPTLDSLGVVGGDAHTEREYVELLSLHQRTALGAVLLRRLLRDSLYAPDGGR